MGIHMLKIRRSWDRLIFIMGIPILVRRHLYIETVPWYWYHIMTMSYQYSECRWGEKTVVKPPYIQNIESTQGPCFSEMNPLIPGIRITLIKITRRLDRPIFIARILILVSENVYIETIPTTRKCCHLIKWHRPHISGWFCFFVRQWDNAKRWRRRVLREMRIWRIVVWQKRLISSAIFIHSVMTMTINKHIMMRR